MTDNDVPEHLIKALIHARRFVDNPDDADAASVAAVLAALRPEDAHLLPMPYSLTTEQYVKVSDLVRRRTAELDGARAAVEHLKAENERLRGALRGVVKSQEAL